MSWARFGPVLRALLITVDHGFPANSEPVVKRRVGGKDSDFFG